MVKKDKFTQILLRVTELEKAEIQKRAKMENKSVNQYLKDSAMGVEHSNERWKAELLKYMIGLQLNLQTDSTLDELKNHVSETRIKIIRSIEEW